MEKQETGLLVIRQENKSHLGVISGTFTQHEPCNWIETSNLDGSVQQRTKNEYARLQKITGI